MKRKSPANDQALSRGIVILVRALVAAALLISLYLAYASFRGGAIAGCGPESGCDKVLQSRWSRWFGIPVSVPAIVVYGLMLAATLRLTPGATPAQQRQAWLILLPTAWAVIAAVVWFASLQIGIINAICLFCMASHACGIVAALLLLFNAPIRVVPEKPWQQEKEIYLPHKRASQLTAIALAAACVLIAGQAVHRPKQFQVSAVAEPVLQQTPTNRLFQIYEGRFTFNINEVPLIGAPTAPHAIVSLFDYTCHHCRIVHGTLKEVHKTFSNQLAIINLPMPLDSACNYTVRMTPSAHSNACEYARLGLAVWRANRAVHPKFDDWVFEPEHPPPLTNAQQYAAQLVGPQNLQAALGHHTVTEYLQLGINIYATNFIHVRQGSMPQLIIGTNLLTGTVAIDEVYRRLDNQLGLKVSQPK